MGKGQTTNREGKGSQQRGAVWGRGQEKRRRRRRCPPGEETGGPPGSSEAIRGGQGEDAYPGRSLLRVASGLMPNPLVWAPTASRRTATPSASSMHESHSIDYINLILSLFWITTKATTKLRKDILTQAHCSPLFSQPPQSSSSTPRRHNFKASVQRLFPFAHYATKQVG